MAERKTAAQQACAHAIHVDWDARHGRFDVTDAEGVVIGHAADQDEAIALAIARAHHAHGAGMDVMVCVGQPDGSYRLAWSSPANRP